MAFDMVTGEKIFVRDKLGSCAFAMDGSILVSYNGNAVAVWEIPSGRQLRRFPVESGRGDAADQIALSPDKKLLAISGFTKFAELGIVSLESGRVLARPVCCPPDMACYYVCFSPAGRVLATDTYTSGAGDRTVEPLLKFWQLPASW